MKYVVQRIHRTDGVEDSPSYYYSPKHHDWNHSFFWTEDLEIVKLKYWIFAYFDCFMERLMDKVINKNEGWNYSLVSEKDLLVKQIIND